MKKSTTDLKSRVLAISHQRLAFATLLWLVIGVAVANAELAYPPVLPGGVKVATDTSAEFLKRPASLPAGVEVAKTPPTIDFLYYPKQTYPGNPWSVWGDSLAVGGKYYSAIGDHLGPRGNAFLFEYDPQAKSMRALVDVQKLIDLPEGHYTPGKIHSRIDLGGDGWLYFATHRGSTRVTTDEYHYTGDWIIRHHPGNGKTEIVARDYLLDLERRAFCELCRERKSLERMQSLIQSGKILRN